MDQRQKSGSAQPGKICLRAAGRTLLLGVLLASASQAVAGPIAPPASTSILYTFSGVASGTLNGVSFVNAAFTITAEANTSLITSPASGVFSVFDSSATISIAGLGLATFTDQMYTVLNRNSSANLPAIGFSDLTKGVAVIAESNPTFGAYDLGNSESDVIATSDGLSPYNTFATSRGNLSLTSVSDANYSASLSVPDAASTFGLLSLSVAMLGLLRRKYGFSNAA